MMRALERHGLPFKIYYTGNDADAVLSKKLDTILAALQNDSVVGIPGKKGDTDVDVIRTPSAINHFIEFIKYVDTLITRTILGQELMTEMPGGVNNGAAASVQRTVFGEISSIDRQQLAETITSTILEYDRVLNYPNLDVRYKPKFQFRSPLAADATQFLTTVQAAINLGLDVSEEQIREATALRQPANHETVVNLETINERKINLQPDRLGSEEEGMEESLGEQERKIQSGKDPSGKSTRSTTAQKTRGTSQKINEGRLSQSR
jgi:phage gp29-like protein